MNSDHLESAEHATPPHEQPNRPALATPMTDEVLRIALNYGAYPGSDGADGVTAQQAHDEMVEALETHARKMERDRRLLLIATRIAYTILGDVRHQWAGRHSPEGQGALIAMRDAIAYATGKEAMEVQDEHAEGSATRLA